MRANKNYIKIFSCCIPVKGASRSAICDVHRGKLKIIPNALYNLLPHFDNLTKHEIISFYGEEHKQTVQEYIDFLFENEYAFYCDKEN